MQVVWEADTAAFASRKRAARACQKCRAAKKRCHHTFQRPPEQQADSDGLERVLPNLTHKEPIRFVGDLNPESILTDLSSRKQGTQRISRVGTWVEQSRDLQNGLPPEDLGPPPPQKSGDKTPLNVEKYGKVEGGRRTLTGHQRNYLQAVGAFRVLPKATQDALVTTYIACFDGLLPILNGIKLLRDYTEGRCSIFLMQAICLVTCKTEEAAAYLRLYDDGPLLDPIPFARSLHTGLDAAMKADLEPDRVTKIQILTLMHLHNDGPGGIEESSLHLSQAIHDAWTAGLHIHTPGRSPKDQSSMLWWTIWTLDKINACLGGRPIVIANRDIDITRPPLESGVPRSNVINLWLRLGDLLDEVIEFYRPTADPECTGWETEFPPYRSLTEGIDLSLLPISEQSILEICYHVICILSCRAGGPSTTSYTRRISAADRIQELLSNGRHTSLLPIPLVPYAVGLALTVTYRGLRDNAFEDSDRAQADLATRCETLEALSMYWWTADAMARLGRKALKSLQQTGVRKASVAGIVSAMEAEVTACKFGPFEAKGHHGGGHHHSHSSSTPAATLSAAATTMTKSTSSSGGGGSRGNGLHVLSDAAATHSTGTTTNLASSPSVGSGNGKCRGNAAIARAVSNTPASLSATSPKTTQSQQFNNNNSSYASGFSQIPPESAFQYQNYNKSTRFQTSSALNSYSYSHHNPLAPTSSSTTAGGASGSGGAFTSLDVPSSFGPGIYDPQFTNLDELFDGFFDLSMPTIFQDPLFDGDAFLNADLDFGMDPGLATIEGLGYATDVTGAGAAAAGALHARSGSTSAPPSAAAAAGSGGPGGPGNPGSSTPRASTGTAYPEITMH
ncbi:uncharacterized protein Z519_09147 [Cladophialophora bantiana CBS 173.52]|uniref:Xylanolytic transcriptional activator regulatory domain-containing protein n=1 Tax=Cladophialophora bantiana (strain ATCC 10958 / CBS 173.52 / CDC B-1940 / NIH 8579) TaxID=1442370 RepID=A0A0D2EKL1_CLAB1|nr:uncharacterized protein Z519_09147 [Cladophialophora bantiana CBS 173.52]KIW90501.1 hypothetical protein Z519_09147 [Cladophialophora bantiana CBS 173.52]